MTPLEIIFGSITLLCVVLTAIAGWVALYRVNQVNVSFTGTPVDKKEFEKHVADNKAEHEKLHARIGGAERGLELRLSHKLEVIGQSLAEMARKMDNDKTEILAKGEERAAKTHDRINDLVGEVGELRGRLKGNHP